MADIKKLMDDLQNELVTGIAEEAIKVFTETGSEITPDKVTGFVLGYLHSLFKESERRRKSQ
ncbi:hypothetical protein JCM17380_24540 [Desulfosporosinus burensis]